MKGKNRLSKVKLTKPELNKQLLNFLASNPEKEYTLKQLFRVLKLDTHPLKMLCVDILNELLENDVIITKNDGMIAYNGQSHAHQEVVGIFTRTNGGRNFVDTDEGLGIRIYDEDSKHALPGDTVRVSIFAKKRGTTKLRGEVIEIIQRNERPYVGVLQMAGEAAYLLMQNDSLTHDIYIAPSNLNGGQGGDKVLVKVIDWPKGVRNPQGRVVDVLGKTGENNTEMHAILAEYGLPYSYPEEVEAAANQIDPGITPAEIARREDFRDVFTCTIDPRDAKDFDDALSIRRLKDGVWEVGVHIADVSHYVLEGSVIDKEAQQRATSVYLVDRTIPMLPERLCNFICSLRPDEEKLTYSVIFKMNEDAEILSSRIKHTVIRSNRRFTYEEVQAILEHHDEATECALIREGKERLTEPVAAQEVKDASIENFNYDECADELIMLNRMAHRLRDRRIVRGAIEFDREEVRFEIDKDGKPLRTYFKKAKDANKLVEEFMLLANRTVAESIGMQKGPGGQTKTLPYRIHDLPDPDKLENLGKFVTRFGLTFDTSGSKTDVAKNLNALLLDVRGQRMQTLVENVSLRAMQKARYSIYNIGHYGLAFDYYTHFTSPIRRYPDTMVHRLLTRYEEGGQSASQKKYEALCQHSSDMEVLASNAERASIKYKQVEFLSDKIGQEFDAHISGITEFGLYAEIDENKCEGLIAVRYLGDEAFDFDDRNYCLVGRKTHHTFYLGDAIRIRVAQANLMRKQLDFDFVSKLGDDSIAPPIRMNFPSIPKGGKRSHKSSRKSSRKGKR